MISPIQSTSGNTSIVFGAKTDTEKTPTPKTEVTQSSATVNAKGNNANLKTEVTASSARLDAIGSIAAAQMQSPQSVNSNKPAAKAEEALLALALQESSPAQMVTVKSTVNPEGVITAYKK